MTKKYKEKVIASSAAVKNEKIEALKHHDDKKKTSSEFVSIRGRQWIFFNVFEVIKKKKRKQFSQKARYYMLEGLAIRAISFDWRAHLNHVDIKDSMRMRTATGFAGI